MNGKLASGASGARDKCSLLPTALAAVTRSNRLMMFGSLARRRRRCATSDPFRRRRRRRWRLRRAARRDAGWPSGPPLARRKTNAQADVVLVTVAARKLDDNDDVAPSLGGRPLNWASELTGGKLAPRRRRSAGAPRQSGAGRSGEQGDGDEEERPRRPLTTIRSIFATLNSDATLAQS